jgi:hypothetical protein
VAAKQQAAATRIIIAVIIFLIIVGLSFSSAVVFHFRLVLVLFFPYTKIVAGREGAKEPVWEEKMVFKCPFQVLSGPICDENSAKKRKELFLFFKGEVLIILFRIEKWCRFEMHQEKVTLCRLLLPRGNTLVKTGNTIIPDAPMKVILMESPDR